VVLEVVDDVSTGARNHSARSAFGEPMAEDSIVIGLTHSSDYHRASHQYDMELDAIPRRKQEGLCFEYYKSATLVYHLLA
jgi:hypothetical protein